MHSSFLRLGTWKVEQLKTISCFTTLLHIPSDKYNLFSVYEDSFLQENICSKAQRTPEPIDSQHGYTLAHHALPQPL